MFLGCVYQACANHLVPPGRKRRFNTGLGTLLDNIRQGTILNQVTLKMIYLRQVLGQNTGLGARKLRNSNPRSLPRFSSFKQVIQLQCLWFPLRGVG